MGQRVKSRTRWPYRLGWTFAGSGLAVPAAGQAVTGTGAYAFGLSPGFSGSGIAGLPGDNLSRILAILNGREPHFSYSVPADPVSSGDWIECTTAAQFNAAADDNGSRIYIPSSFSGAIEILANDIDIVMENTATITGTLNLGTGSVWRTRRVRWTGGNINGRLLGRQFEDILFDDVNFNYNIDGNYNDLTANSNRFYRIAFINCTLQNTGNPGGDGWVLFCTPQSTSSTANPHEGIILGNVRVISTALHAFRLQGIADVVIFDSAFNPDNAAGSTGFRLHYGCQNVWMRDSYVVRNIAFNQVSPGGDSIPHVINGVFDNVTRYAPDAQFAWSGGNMPSNSAEIRNSRLHAANGAGDGTLAMPSGFTSGGGNDRVAWDGSTLPDYSAIGAIR